MVWVCLLPTCLMLPAQQISYFNQGFLRQPSAQLDRDYLGIFGTNITGWGTPPPWIVTTNIVTNYIPGTNILFTLTAPLQYTISGTGGGGGGTTNNFYYTNNFYQTNYYSNDFFFNTNVITLTGDATGSGTNITVSVTNITPLGTAGRVLTATGTGMTWSNVPASTTPIPFEPTNIPHCALFLTYQDFPVGAVTAGWTNKVATNQIFAIHGTINNTASGMYFDGNAANYFNNATSGIRWSTANDSIWVVFYPERVINGGNYDSILSSSSLAGHGLYAYNNTFVVNNTAGTLCTAYANTDYDLAVVSTGSGRIVCYTNGVVALSPTMTATSETVWGIGRDADADQNFKGYIKYIAVWTNYSLTISDLVDLHDYASAAAAFTEPMYVAKSGDTMTGALVMDAPLEVKSTMYMSNAPGGPLTDYQFNMYGGLFVHTNGMDDGMGGVEPLGAQISVFDTNDLETILLDGSLGTVSAKIFTTCGVGGIGFCGNGSALTGIPNSGLNFTAATNGASITLGQLPSGVLTNNMAMSAPMITSNSIVIAQTNVNAGLFITNGTLYVVATNGVLKASGAIAGTAVSGSSLSSSSWVRTDSRAYFRSPTINSVSLGPEDAALTNLWLYGYATVIGGSTNACIGHTPGAIPVVTIRNATNGPANLNVGGNLTATNGIYYLAVSNAIIGANVLQPLHAWAAIMSWGTNTINGGANTYAVITNQPSFTTARSNQFGINISGGVITNYISGFYRCAVELSGVSIDNGAQVEGDLLLNAVERDEISFISVFDPGTPRLKSMSATGILYIGAGTNISFQVKSSGAGGLSVHRVQMVVGSP